MQFVQTQTEIPSRLSLRLGFPPAQTYSLFGHTGDSSWILRLPAAGETSSYHRGEEPPSSSSAAAADRPRPPTPLEALTSAGRKQYIRDRRSQVPTSRKHNILSPGKVGRGIYVRPRAVMVAGHGISKFAGGKNIFLETQRRGQDQTNGDLGLFIYAEGRSGILSS